MRKVIEMNYNLKQILEWAGRECGFEKNPRFVLTIEVFEDAKKEIKKIEDFKNAWAGYNPEQIKGIVDERYYY